MRVLTRDIGQHEDETTELCGWVVGRRDHGSIIFIDLMDYSGTTQCVLDESQGRELRPEWVIKISGQVVKRPKGMVNPDLPTGQWEVKVKALEILSKAETSPFALDTDGYEIGEENRLQYRYLDLRRPRLRKNLRQRQRVLNFIRQYLIERDFVEVETPILSKSTPEGARDYLVPSRLQKGKFYALPQSPQQYKQLLMVAGLERYFQIARCFRDEDTRGDRQPEFTQLDLEMSFAEREEVMDLIEDLYTKIIEALFPEKRIAEKLFPRLTYAAAMEKYNSDKPDLRKNKEDSEELALTWITDFPFFEKTGDGWTFTHNPFSAPKKEHLPWLLAKEKIGEILTTQYDLVLNGEEIGGGSVRSHRPEALQAVLETIGLQKKTIRENFGPMLDALKYGAPPHGGIAMGLDRFLAILFNEPNIREVIAFPKTGDGRDLMMNAPAAVDKKQLFDLGLKQGPV